jgi:hypothetical protein
MRAVVSPVQTTDSRAGSLLELLDLQTGVDLAEGGDYGSVHCGDFVPMDGTVTMHGIASATFSSSGMIDHSTMEELPISLSVTYRLVERGLEVTYQVSATDTAEISVPLEADFGLKPYVDGFVKFHNQTIEEDRRNALNGTHETFRVSGDQEVELYGPGCEIDTWFIFPNPSKAMLTVSGEEYPDNEYLSMRFFDVEPPRDNCAGPDLHSRLGPGSFSSYYVRMFVEEGQTPIYFSYHPDMYERTASWIMDEIPLVHPGQGYMWDFSETSSGDEWVSAWLIRMLEDHPEMNMNILILGDGILEPNCDSMWYEPGYQDSWSHWHCTWRVATEAPADYKQWLINIQNDVYPWSERVNLGCHGYHHTPSPDSAWDPYHEFITYELEEHQERFDMIQSDYTDIGLDAQEAMRTLRPPGNRVSLSALWALVDHGFRYYSNGARWNEWMAGEWFWDLYLCKYETPHGRMWGANTVWWADYLMMSNYDYLITVMDRGKHGLLGGHPMEIFGNGDEAAYDRIDSVCTSLEQDYAHFGWLLPLDYAEFMDELYVSTVDSVRSTWTSASMHFTGSTSYGQTVVAKLPESVSDISATVDGQPATWELYDGNRVFVDADGLSGGSHQVTIQWEPVGIEEESTSEPGERIGIFAPNPTGRSIPVSVTGLGGNQLCELSVFDMAGRRLASKSVSRGAPGPLQVDFMLPSNVSTGVYILTARSGDRSACRKLVLIGR